MSSFAYTAVEIAEIARLHTSSRLTSYVVAASGNLRDALELYVWNTAVASAFYGPLQATEVAFRNALNDALTVYLGPTWFDTTSFLSIDPRFRNQVHKAKKSILRDGRAVTPSRVVAKLTFGFWTTLLNPGPGGAYVTSLWGPALKNAFPYFPGRPQRKVIVNELTKLRHFRNRIAHHEPIHARNLNEDYERVLRVAEWISPTLPLWIDHHARCVTLIGESPRPRQRF